MVRWQAVLTLAYLLPTSSSRAAPTPLYGRVDVYETETTQNTDVRTEMELHGAVGLPDFPSGPPHAMQDMPDTVPLVNGTTSFIQPAVNTDDVRKAFAALQNPSAGPASRVGSCHGPEVDDAAPATSFVTTYTTVTVTQIEEEHQTAVQQSTTTTTITLAGNPVSQHISSQKPQSHQTYSESTSMTATQVQVSATHTSATKHTSKSTQQSTTLTTIQPATSSTSVKASSTASSGDSASSDFKQGMVDQHNHWRSQYLADPLEWDADLATAAQAWAEKCVWEHDPDLGNLHYGQNLDSAATSDGNTSLSPKDVLDHWVLGEGERDAYNPQNPQMSHFTQVVWKATTRVGCALVVCPLSMYDPSWPPAKYVVCDYAVAGNVEGAFTQNVGI